MKLLSSPSFSAWTLAAQRVAPPVGFSQGWCRVFAQPHGMPKRWAWRPAAEPTKVTQHGEWSSLDLDTLPNPRADRHSRSLIADCLCRSYHTAWRCLCWPRDHWFMVGISKSWWADVWVGDGCGVPCRGRCWGECRRPCCVVSRVME